MSFANAVRAAAEAAPFLVLTHRAYFDLRDELGGGEEAAMRWLHELATEIGHPICLNFAGGSRIEPDAESTSMFIPPDGWGHERLTGWVAGHAEQLESAFGPIGAMESGGKP